MYGINYLSIVPVRKLPNDPSEQVNQILFGEQFFIENIDKKWCLIRGLLDNYVGWVDKKQITILETELDGNYIVNVPTLKFEDKQITIGSFIEQTRLNKNEVIELLKNETIVLNQPNWNRKNLLKNAKKLINSPYLWGGKSPFGIDCSGFTQIIFRLNGIHLKRDAYQQAEEGKSIEYSQVKSGDLAFFNTDKSEKITHVGIVDTDSSKEIKIIHASGWVQSNNFTLEGIINNKHELSHHLLFIKRIID